jgi:hypothetical protein
MSSRGRDRSSGPNPRSPALAWRTMYNDMPATVQTETPSRQTYDVQE